MSILIYSTHSPSNIYKVISKKKIHKNVFVVLSRHIFSPL